MYPFVETIRIENGEISHLRFHNERLNRTRQEVFGCTDRIELAEYVSAEGCQQVTRCRVEYREQILSVDYIPYEMRVVNSLQLVECNEIDYHNKSTDRRLLNQLFEQRGMCDDVLIVRNGLLTDTTLCTIALWDGNAWYTPATPLLPGTQRAFLIEEGLIRPRDIRPADLPAYSSIRLFNALIRFGQIEFPVANINVKQW